MGSGSDGHGRSEERETFDEFALGASTTLFRAAIALTGDRGHAEDLLQETLFRTARHWKAARVAPMPYSRQVLLNLARDRSRAKRRQLQTKSLGLGDDPWPGFDAGETEIVLERQSMRVALAQLTEQQRQVVVLRYLLDVSVVETADALDIPEGTVKSISARALTRLRGLLEENPTITQEVQT